MPINNITQTISTIPPAGARGVDVQTVFVNKQEDFQDHLQGTTVTELNTLKDQLNTRINEINSTATTMNGYAATASAGASTATTKAGEASTSASGALTSRNQAETFKNNASASATKSSQWADNNYNVEVETGKYSAKHWATVAQAESSDIVKLTGNQTIADVKTFSSSPIVPTPTSYTEAANKAYVDDKTVATAVPVATVIIVAKNTAPTGYLKANGALLSRTTYAALFASIGTTFGIGDNSTTFALPDLRGYFPRGWDDGRGIDASRVFGSNQGDSYKNHSHTASSDLTGAHSHTYTVNTSGTPGSSIATGAANSNQLALPTSSAGAHTHTITVNTSTTGSTETRPINIALLYCIKY